ncbi:DUF3305 domain-containing protein [Loktanella sp. DSM 29012]|uniref:DUF3305 domain-containing protein n=1 Tax=Loktanella sp. DSM 29012 TaxID=1881056 RepID=UPI000B7C808E|nr:DUF3305 domain-containing protein [Loktanella sp. DSM 29012]
MPIGVVVRRAPGVTRWAKWSWKATDVLPGAGPADWTTLRTVDDVTYFHVATLDVDLHASDTEAYVHELQTRCPSLYIIMRADTARSDAPLRLVSVTASPYEAQDYADNGEDIVEKVAMPAAVRNWVEAYVARHHVEVPFVKRRRDRQRVDTTQDGIGDHRINQTTDVYRAPTTHETQS